MKSTASGFVRNCPTNAFLPNIFLVPSLVVEIEFQKMTIRALCFSNGTQNCPK